MKHAVAALAATWQRRHARRIEAGLQASSPEVSDNNDDDPTMEMGSDNPAPESAPVHAGFTMEQAQAHYNATKADVQPPSVPPSALQLT